MLWYEAVVAFGLTTVLAHLDLNVHMRQCHHCASLVVVIVSDICVNFFKTSSPLKLLNTFSAEFIFWRVSVAGPFIAREVWYPELIGHVLTKKSDFRFEANFSQTIAQINTRFCPNVFYILFLNCECITNE